MGTHLKAFGSMDQDQEMELLCGKMEEHFQVIIRLFCLGADK
jgi:hypothetical protein